MKRWLGLIAFVAIAVAGCSSSEGGDTATNATSGTTSADVTVAPDDGSNENPAPQDSSPPPPPADGRYFVGDTYYDVDLSATYLGLAQVPVGPDIFSGGTCYTVLLEVNRYADVIQLGPEKFQASTNGILSDGTEAENDSTGVGCDLKPLAALGYEQSIDTGLVLGDTKRTYLGSIWVPDGATLDGVTLYGSDQTFLVADVVVDAAG